jgi:Protein of unknown function (DUF1656)
MRHTFRELVIGGVLVAPFVIYAMAALFALVLMRPFLRFVGFSRIFGGAAIAEVSLFLTIMGLLILLS